MEAHGIDAVVGVNHSHITISWKTLRGRLASTNGAPNEVISLSRIYDVYLLPANENSKGCFQIHMIGSTTSVAPELTWLSDIREGRIDFAVMFNHGAQFQFNGVSTFIKEQIKKLRMPDLNHQNQFNIADGA